MWFLCLDCFSVFSDRVGKTVPLSAPASLAVLEFFRSVLEIRSVSVESEARSLCVDPPLSGRVFLRLGSLHRSFYGYDFQFIRVVLPFLCFSPLSPDPSGLGSGEAEI